ncbi:gas vesicle protein GvpO [Kitasatospora cineracea]|uniref:Gas vesicle protein GvpO n=1 Tax=Kitasatospora cineracea TaxID=88074 RepID=A0A8G1UNQ2_9ACTN|nr:gas vesicle protein GvpO [Kitasatospora cineracea]ROR46274.1 gas vesicle protein GvpO [Kitasatospora cineracea]
MPEPAARKPRDRTTRSPSSTAAPRRRTARDPEAEAEARPRRRPAADDDREREAPPGEDEAPGDTGRTRSRDSGSDRSDRAEDDGIGAAEAAGRAAAQVRAMTGRSPEGVTSVERTEDGWRIGVEVVESHRIPDSTDILALYQVDLDHDGDLRSYRRESRYHRGRFPDQEDPP